MKPLPRPLAGMFFDLDGTLVDSARDMHDALAGLCRERGIVPPPFATVRETVSRGARAVLGCAFSDGSAVDEAMPRFLELYSATGMRHTHAFPGIDALLEKLEARGVRWGVITNKVAALAEQVLRHQGYQSRLAALVAGDTLSRRKPDPEPVWHACELAGVDPVRCVFVGDDPRDVAAGNAAGVYTVAAGWGYLDGADPRTWEPDAVADDAAQLARWLD
jgi:N-acetyl-D-muramate 6-phosphate phosphatase